MLVSAFSDVLTMNFFWMVRDEGSWLDIGSSISHFCIASLLCVFVAGLEVLSEVFVSGVRVGGEGDEEGEEDREGKGEGKGEEEGVGIRDGDGDGDGDVGGDSQKEQAPVEVESIEQKEITNGNMSTTTTNGQS